MIKTFALIARRKDHTREAFREHYESTHAPMALPLMQGLARYVRYHLTEVLHGSPVFDVISGFWYATGEDAAATVRRVESEAGEAIRADELRFMDKPRNEVLVARPEWKVEGEEGDEPLFVLVRAPREGRETWLEAHDATLAPALVRALDSPRCVLQHRTVAVVPGLPGWDRITQLDAEGPGALQGWIETLESSGATVCVVRTRAHETQTAGDLPEAVPGASSP